jgi:hypothetical protein
MVVVLNGALPDVHKAASSGTQMVGCFVTKPLACLVLCLGLYDKSA